jgi:hypothetical protein
VSMLWAMVLGIVLLGVGPGSRGALAAPGLLLLGISEARLRSGKVGRDHHPAARRRRLGSVWSPAGVGFALLAAVTAADVVFTPQLLRRYGAASILVPAVALGVVVTGRIMIGSGMPARADKIKRAVSWLAVCALGALLVSGVPSRHDEQLGAWLLAFAIGSAELLWSPVMRVFNRGWARVKPVAKFLLGDWENDVGFLGDGRGSRERVDSIDPLRDNAALPGPGRGGAGND